MQPLPIGHVPEDALGPDNLALSVVNWSLDDTHEEPLARGGDMFFDILESLAAAQDPPVILTVLLGKFRREQVEVGFANDVVRSAARGVAESLVHEDKPALENPLRQTCRGSISTSE